jgi:hypothetical protein
MRLGRFEEAGRRHEDVNCFRGTRALRLGSAGAMGMVFAAGRMSGCGIWVLAISRADERRRWRGVRRQAGSEAKV